MKIWNRYALSLLVVCLLAAASGQVWGADKPAAASVAIGAPVIVANTPLPVTGSLGVSGTVQVGNAPSNPVPVRSADAIEPVQLAAFFGFGGGSGSQTSIKNPDGTTYAVPAGKLLVVEYVSAQLALDPGEKGISFGVGSATGAGIEAAAALAPFTFVGSNAGKDTFVGGQLVRTYFKAGDPVLVSCSKNDSTGNPSCLVSVVGHLVTLP